MVLKKMALNESGQTVFSLADVARISGRKADENLVSAMWYYVQKGDLVRLAKGLYAFDMDYDRQELGNKLRVPSYVSLYTILQEKGVVFQPYSKIFLVGNRSERLEVKGQKYVYRKIKDEILLDERGIESEGMVAKASLERAILDKLYLDGEEHFDNLREVDWDKMCWLNGRVYGRKNINKYIEKHDVK